MWHCKIHYHLRTSCQPEVIGYHSTYCLQLFFLRFRQSTHIIFTSALAQQAMQALVQPEQRCPSVCPSVTLRYCIKTKKASVMISSPAESLNILVSRNIWFITKFDRGHPERGRFLRLGWVRTGDFGDFSTNKPPYPRNGARQDQGCY